MPVRAVGQEQFEDLRLPEGYKKGGMGEGKVGLLELAAARPLS